MTNQTKHTKELKKEFEKKIDSLYLPGKYIHEREGVVGEKFTRSEFEDVLSTLKEVHKTYREELGNWIEKTLTSREEELIEEMRNSFEQIAHDLIDNRDNSKGKDRLRFQAQLEIVKYLLNSLKRKEK